MTRPTATPTWSERYADRHRYLRLTGDPSLPNGRRGRVTIYQRGPDNQDPRRTRFVLSWCRNGRHRKETVRGDKFDAVRRADEINAALRAGTFADERSELSADELVTRYVEFLERRADAGEISPRTPVRYRSALSHFTTFVARDTDQTEPGGWAPSRALALRLKAHLHGVRISPNGHPNSSFRPISPKGLDFIMASVRAMIRWAASEQLLPSASTRTFAQPDQCRARQQAMSAAPITTDELIRLIHVADKYQLTLLAFYIFHGVRVSEPCWLMLEDFDTQGGWLNYRCIERLGYRTKGGVDKNLPVPDVMSRAILHAAGNRHGGPLLVKRRLADTHVTAPEGLDGIIHAVERQTPPNWSERGRLARAHLKKIGAIDGDDVRREFRQLVRAADVRHSVTPKALRHFFGSALERSDVPYYTRKYLLGHRLTNGGARGDDVTATYTHLEPNQIKTAYQLLLDGSLREVADPFTARLVDLGGSTTARHRPCTPAPQRQLILIR